MAAAAAMASEVLFAFKIVLPSPRAVSPGFGIRRPHGPQYCRCVVEHRRIKRKLVQDDAPDLSSCYYNLSLGSIRASVRAAAVSSFH
jgi:hypothetical protein